MRFDNFLMFYFLFFASPPFLFFLPPPPIVFPYCYCPMFTDQALSPPPLQQQRHLTSPTRKEGLNTFSAHKPLERTRSEPPPYSHSPMTLHAGLHCHTQHQPPLQCHKSGVERFKLNSLLSKVRICGCTRTHATLKFVLY